MLEDLKKSSRRVELMIRVSSDNKLPARPELEEKIGFRHLKEGYNFCV